MKPFGRLSIVVLATALVAVSPAAAVPGMINYQGEILVNGQPFNGIGNFRFALVNGDGTITYWTNDGNPITPTLDVVIQVQDGVYSVVLGETPDMEAIPEDVFTNEDVYLRVWFDDGSTGIEQLGPDQRLVSSGYAFKAANADSLSGEVYSSIWPTTLNNVQAACTNDYHAIGGTDDDQPDSDSEVPDSISIDNGRLYAPAGTGSVGIGTTTPGGMLGFKNDQIWITVDSNDDLVFRDLHAGTWSLFNLSRSSESPWSRAGDRLFYLDGNVGIGTSNPEKLLTVTGTVGIYDDMELNGDIDQYGNIILDGLMSTTGDITFLDDAGCNFGGGRLFWDGFLLRFDGYFGCNRINLELNDNIMFGTKYLTANSLGFDFSDWVALPQNKGLFWTGTDRQLYYDATTGAFKFAALGGTIASLDSTGNAAFTGTVSGAIPTASSHFTTKSFLDTQIAGVFSNSHTFTAPQTIQTDTGTHLTLSAGPVPVELKLLGGVSSNTGIVRVDANQFQFLMNSGVFTFDKQVQAPSFSGNGSALVIALDNLSDVSAPTPQNGQVLTWNSSASRWVAKTPVVETGVPTENERLMGSFDTVKTRSLEYFSSEQPPELQHNGDTAIWHDPVTGKACMVFKAGGSMFKLEGVPLE
ncbi:hypothetical protein JW905_00810 [bacterium]|nr:hypothetical protein [candidate division CSSED10-310 bacterium]